MNISHDFVLRFERVKEEFKKSMYTDLCSRVDAYFAPLLEELKEGANAAAAAATADSGPQTLVDVAEVDACRDNASSHFSLSTSLLDHHHPSPENGLIVGSNDHLLVGSDPFWGGGNVVSDVVEPSKLIGSTEELSVGADSISTPVNIIRSTASSLAADGTVSTIKEELLSDHEENMDDHEAGEAFGEDEGSTNCDCSDCRSEEDEEIEGELFGTKKVKLERQLSDEIAFDESTSPLEANFYEIPGSSSNELASSPSALVHSSKKKSREKIHFCNKATCLASFRKHCQLVAHRRSHWSTRFRCKWPGCKSDFASRSNIYRHLRSMHLAFEQQEQPDNEQDLKNFFEEITVKNAYTSQSVAPVSVEPPSSTSLSTSSGLSSSSISSVSNTQKCYRCKWPMCDYTGEHSGNITRHIRTQHFQLPRTVREQRDKNIFDDRDPYAFVEVFLKPIGATTTGQVISTLKLSGSDSLTDGFGDGDETAGGCTLPPMTATKNSAAGADGDLLYSGAFSQIKQEEDLTSCAKAVSTGKGEANEMEVMTTLAATAVAAAAAAAAAGGGDGGGNSSISMDYSDNDEPVGTYHF